MYKCTIGNDVKENPKSSSQFNLISCIYIIFINMETWESQFFLVITVLRKWALCTCHTQPTSPVDWLPGCMSNAPPVMVLRTTTLGVGENLPYAYGWIKLHILAHA